MWMPGGAVLKEARPLKEEGSATTTMTEFVFEAPVDPNDDRLEHWEQEVVGKGHLREWRARLVWQSLRSMLRFYGLDRIVCWDLSWGIWEAVRDDSGGEAAGGGFPAMKFVRREGGKEDHLPFPASFEEGSGAGAEAAREAIYDCCRPVSSAALAETLRGVSGYYLVGGNTYTMSLFHNMWDRQASLEKEKEEGKGEGGAGGGIGHMQLLRNQLKEGALFYMGHSAGLIMSGPNILTATFKGIDAFSVVTQARPPKYLRIIARALHGI